MSLTPGHGEEERQRKAAASLIDETLGFLLPAALRAAAELGIADHLADGPRTVSELAAAAGADPRNLYRVLRLLATRDIVRQDDTGRFALTEAGVPLSSRAPYSVHRAVLMLTDRTFWLPAGEMTRSVTDGRQVFESTFGMPFFDYFAQDPATAEVFHAGMAAMSEPENEPIAAACDFPSAGTVVDVGGGHGGLLHAVLRHRPGLAGVLFDQAHVLDEHRLHPEQDPDIAGRWCTAAGDFFTAVPPADLYLIKRILHDWDDDQCVTILRNCRATLRPGGRVLAIDAVIGDDNLPHQAKALDLLMMTALVGRERTREEFAALFEAAGLRLTRIVPTPTVLALIEAVAE